MSDIAALVDAQVAAYRDRQLERFLGFYADDVTVRDLDGNVLMSGLQAMRDQYGPLFRDSADLAVDIPARMQAGDYLIDEELITGFQLAGFPTQMHVLVIYRVHNSKISEVVLVS
jgi:hypothetical protein